MTHTHTHNSILFRQFLKSTFLFTLIGFSILSCSDDAVDNLNQETNARSVSTVQDLVLDIESHLNITYANPSVTHDLFDVTTSSFTVQLEENKSISTANVSQAFDDALSLIECHFYCHHFTNKNPTFFDIEFIETVGDVAYLEVSSGIGNQSTSSNLPKKEFLPGDEENASGQDICLSNLIDFSLELGAAPKVAEYLTYNVRIGQTLESDEYYKDIEEYHFNGAVFPGDVDYTPGDYFGWNDGTPDDLMIDFNSFKFQCNVGDYPNCSIYFTLNGPPTPLWKDVYCLDFGELNFYLDKETIIAENCANFYNSDLLNFTSYYNHSAQGKGFWQATEKYGRKVKRNNLPINLNSPSNGCTCN